MFLAYTNALPKYLLKDLFLDNELQSFGDKFFSFPHHDSKLNYQFSVDLPASRLTN